MKAHLVVSHATLNGTIAAIVAGSPQTAANAHLIAAAPDYDTVAARLLDAVEKCSRCDGNGQHPRRRGDACDECGGVGEVFGPGAVGHIGDLRAAIKKARGE